MTDLQKAIIKEVEKFNDSIVKALDSKNISNTREAAKSLYVDYGNDFVRSIGIFYLEFLDTGRGPGKMPPIAPIQKWAKVKFSVDDKEAEQIAWGVAKNIKKVGTEIFRNNSKGIELSKKIVTLRKSVIEIVQEQAVIEIKQRLNKFKIAHIKNKYQI
jgi:hypothetical protein